MFPGSELKGLIPAISTVNPGLARLVYCKSQPYCGAEDAWLGPLLPGPAKTCSRCPTRAGSSTNLAGNERASRGSCRGLSGSFPRELQPGTPIGYLEVIDGGGEACQVLLGSDETSP